MCGAFVTALSTLAQNAVPLPAHAYYQLFLDFPCNYHLKWVTVGPISQFVTMTGFVIVRLERYSNTARYCNTFPLCWLQAALCLLSIFFYFPIVWIQILKKFLLLIFLNSLLKLFHVFSTVFFEHHCALRYFSSCPSLTTDSQRKLTDCASAGWTGRLLSVKVLGGGGGISYRGFVTKQESSLEFWLKRILFLLAVRRHHAQKHLYRRVSLAEKLWSFRRGSLHLLLMGMFLRPS